MKQLIEYIVSNIVNHPESVIVTEELDKEVNKYFIKVDPEDVGRVIGKEGKVIKSIRQIVRIAAIQKGTRAIVDLLEDGEARQDKEDIEPVSESSEELVEEKKEALEEVAEEIEEKKEEVEEKQEDAE